MRLVAVGDCAGHGSRTDSRKCGRWWMHLPFPCFASGLRPPPSAPACGLPLRCGTGRSMLRPAPSFPRNAPARKLARRLRTTARQDTSWPSLSLRGIWGGFAQANSRESSSLDARPRSVGAPPGVKEKEGVSGARRLPFASGARIKFAGSDSEPCRIAAPSRTASRHHRRFLTLRPCGQTLAPRNPAVD